MKVFRICLCLAVFTVSLVAFADDQHHHDAYDPNNLGTVSFPTSCSTKVQKDFEKGVALLHSFWYEEAEKAFTTVKQHDPKCSMAAWGIAMSRWHQLWEPPKDRDIKFAQVALNDADDFPPKTERERGFITAMRAFYFAGKEPTHQHRAEAYSAAMAKLHERFPADNEVTVFYALSLLAATAPGERDIDVRKKAGALLQPVFAAEPQHPGVAHYLIHSYDTPELAQLGLPAAREYAKVAPSAPHALHMPSHIFSRVGMWQESVKSNLASIAATRHSAAMHMGGADHQMHAMDFLQYAYLQMGQDEKAAALLTDLDGLHADDGEEMDYTRSMLEVRQALEEHDWKRAAHIEVPANVRPWLESMVRGARAMGAARSGNLEGAQREIDRMKQLEEKLLEQGNGRDAFVAVIVKVDRQKAEAWLKHARGEDEVALDEMRKAAAADEKTGGEGVLAPAAESYADLLLASGKAADALDEYQYSMKLAPNRFNSLYGAAVAAEKAGKADVAQKYYAQLVETAGESRRPEVAQAKSALSKNAAGGGQ